MIFKNAIKQDRQYTYNVTLMRVLATAVFVAKQFVECLIM